MLHHGDFEVAHHYVAVGVHALHLVVLDLGVFSRTQAILGARANGHWSSKEEEFWLRTFTLTLLHLRS